MLSVTLLQSLRQWSVRLSYEDVARLVGASGKRDTPHELLARVAGTLRLELERQADLRTCDDRIWRARPQPPVLEVAQTSWLRCGSRLVECETFGRKAIRENGPVSSAETSPVRHTLGASGRWWGHAQPSDDDDEKDGHHSEASSGTARGRPRRFPGGVATALFRKALRLRQCPNDRLRTLVGFERAFWEAFHCSRARVLFQFGEIVAHSERD